MSSFILRSKQVYEVEKNIKPSFDLMNNAGKLSAKYILGMISTSVVGGK